MRGELPVNVVLEDIQPGHAGKPLGTRFTILEVGAETLRIEDEHGERRVVCRMITEGQWSRGELVVAKKENT